MKERQFRNKITWYTFIFSILVIWVHSYNSELFLGKTPSAKLVYDLEHFMGGTIAQIAVPGFFMLSSYLFFRNFTWDVLLQKWKSRFLSVAVPFVLWNILYYAGYLLASRIPVMTDVVGRGSVPFSPAIFMKAVLGYTYNPVFWYLFQLILLIIAAPVIYGILKNKWIGVSALLILLFVIARGGSIPVLNLDALFYYSAAAYCALHQKRWVEGPYTRNTLLAAGILFTAAVVFGIRQNLFHSIFDTVMFRFLAPVSLWMFVDPFRLPEVKKWMTYNFFLYATHFAVVRFVNKAGSMVFPSHTAVPLILYLLMPVIAVAVNYTLAVCLRRFAPPLWRILNGGRLPAA